MHCTTIVLMLVIIFFVVIGYTCFCKPVEYMTENHDHQVIIRDFTFIPQELAIQRGDTVTWINEDLIGHTATSGVDPDPDGLFNSGLLNQGDTYSFTFAKPGSFDYYCIPHPFMQGTIVVD